MSDFRCYANDLNPSRDQIVLTPFESHHLVATNRARLGDQVVVFNGAGVEWDAKLTIADRKEAVLARIRTRVVENPKRKITLAIAVIKGKAFDTILRQSAELGVATLQPLLTERTEVKVKETASKFQKWQSHLVEGCKQSGNSWLPRLKTPVSLFSFLNGLRQEEGIVASLENSAGNWEAVRAKDQMTLFVGPEGDFSPREYAVLSEKGVQAVSLGRHVLRSETAVICALAQLSMRMTPLS